MVCVTSLTYQLIVNVFLNLQRHYLWYFAFFFLSNPACVPNVLSFKLPTVCPLKQGS